MKSIRIHAHGGPEVLKIDDIPEPTPKPGEARVRIQACAMNHMDLWVRKGLPGVNIPLPIILGCEGVGVIESLVPGAEGPGPWKVGDEVLIAPGYSCGSCEACLSGNDHYCRGYGIYGENSDGCETELKCIPLRQLLPKPKNFSFEEAATLPLTFLTAWHMLEKCGLKPGQDVLVVAASSGVGSAAVQIAKRFGARVIATVGGVDKMKKAESLGADDVLDHNTQDIAAEVKKLTHKKGAEIVFEHVGAATWEKSLKSLSFGGKLVTCGATTGPEVKVDLRHIFIKHQQIIGSTMGPKSALFTILREVESGHFKPVVDQVFPMSDVVAAHHRLEDRKAFGKVVLKIG